MNKKKLPLELRVVESVFGGARKLSKAAIDTTDEAIFAAVNAVPGYDKTPQKPKPGTLKSYGQSIREAKLKLRKSKRR
ncbi:MAG: hypothetical protein AAGF54_17670 [Pseudomonadota bacterium]